MFTDVVMHPSRYQGGWRPGDQSRARDTEAPREPLPIYPSLPKTLRYRPSDAGAVSGASTSHGHVIRTLLRWQGQAHPRPTRRDPAVHPEPQRQPLHTPRYQEPTPLDCAAGALDGHSKESPQLAEHTAKSMQCLDESPKMHLSEKCRFRASSQTHRIRTLRTWSSGVCSTLRATEHLQWASPLPCVHRVALKDC